MRDGRLLRRTSVEQGGGGEGLEVWSPASHQEREMSKGFEELTYGESYWC